MCVCVCVMRLGGWAWKKKKGEAIPLATKLGSLLMLPMYTIEARHVPERNDGEREGKRNLTPFRCFFSYNGRDCARSEQCVKKTRTLGKRNLKRGKEWSLSRPPSSLLPSKDVYYIYTCIDSSYRYCSPVFSFLPFSSASPQSLCTV